jgi:hypothetical protein
MRARLGKTAPRLPRQPTREGQKLADAIVMAHRQDVAASFATGGVEVPVHFDAAGVGTVAHRLGAVPTGAVLVLVPSANDPAFHIVAWDSTSATISASVGCTFRLRFYR